MICPKCGKVLNENEVCSCELPEEERVVEQVAAEVVEEVVEEKNTWLVYVSAIIYPLIVVALGVFLLVSEMTGIINLVLSVLLTVGFALSMLAGGFYLIIIPLPIVYLFNYGCVKPTTVSLGHKILYGILAAVSIVLAILVLFLF